MAEIISSLSDAVTASGKKLTEIGKEPILHYLEKVGTPKKYWDEIYEKLRDLHDAGRHGTSGPGTAGTSGPGNATPSYTQTILPQEKHREPRKTVFGPVKKIAG